MSLSIRSQMPRVFPVVCLFLLGVVEPVFAGPPRVFKVGMSQMDLDREFKAQIENGFRLIDVSVCVVQRDYKFATVWEERGTPQFHFQHGLPGAELLSTYEQAAKDGYRLTHLTAVDAAGALKHLGIWEKTAGPEVQIRIEFPRAGFEEVHQELTKSGHHLLRISAAEKGGTLVFGGAWEQGRSPICEMSLGLSSSAVTKAVATMKKKGFRVVQICGYVTKKVERYAIVWEKAEGPEQKVTVRLTDSGLEKATVRMTKGGFQAKQISIYNVRKLDRYAVVWEKNDAAK